MGSQRTTRARTLALCAALALAAAACGSSDDTTTADSGAQPSPAPASTDDVTTETAGEELPPPDEADFVGSTRIVNLYVDDEGEHQVIDVWAHRSFTHGPVLLAEEIAYGEVSERFGAPDGMSVVIVEHGAGPDAEQIGSLFNPKDGEITTHIYTWESDGVATTSVHWELDDGTRGDEVPAPPEPGEALLILRAGQLSAHEEALSDTYGGRSFNVGAVGVTGCLQQQRVEDAGFTRSVLGGTQPTLHDLAPGTISLTFHRWPADGDCDEDPALGPIEVDLPTGEATLVLLHTPDLDTIEALVLSWGT